MNGEQLIPSITDPIGKHWGQPHRRYIELDDTHALMSEQTFKALVEYSLTLPSEKYAGKMWSKYHEASDTWYLCWYLDSDNPDFIEIEYRVILIV